MPLDLVDCDLINFNFCNRYSIQPHARLPAPSAGLQLTVSRLSTRHHGGGGGHGCCRRKWRHDLHEPQVARNCAHTPAAPLSRLF